MTASIIIPAHNESAVIRRCLTALLADRDPHWQILVVCNGCTDDTARRAGEFDGVEVIEIAEASKVAALNAGDAAATGFPRIYLDADVTVTAAAVSRVVSVLTAGAHAAAPLPHLDLAGCRPLSRAYFTVWSALGYATRSVIGSGCYGLSEGGRGRFGAFPDLISDDGYVYSHFAPDERINPVGATFSIKAPRTIRATLRRRIRIVEGNHQLLARTGRRMDVPAPYWSDVARKRPWLLPRVVVFLTVNLLADVVARRRLRSGAAPAWNRDESSRGGS